MASGSVTIQKEYANSLGAIANDRKILLNVLDNIERSRIIPSRIKQDLIALARSGLDWLNRLEKDVNNAAKKGVSPQEFATGFTMKYADFVQRVAGFYIKYEVVNSYFSEVDGALEKIEKIKMVLTIPFSSIIHPKGRDLANQKEINKILQEFETVELELRKVSSYSLADLITADLKFTENAMQKYISVKYVNSIDERKLQESVWSLTAALYLEHPNRLGQLQRTVASAIKQVEQERDAILAEAWTPVSKGSIGREVLFFSEKEQQAIRKKYSAVIAGLHNIEQALEKRDISSAISQFESAQDMMNSTREEITELRGILFAERLGIGRDVRETVADVLAMVPAGAAIVFKLPWLAAPTEAYFAAKGAFYYHLGQHTNNDELKTQGILMMLPLGFTAASKGMLQLTRFGGTAAEVGVGAAYAFTLSKQAVGIYFTGSMGHDAARQIAFVSEYGLTPERLHELVATGIMALFGVVTAVGPKGPTPVRIEIVKPVKQAMAKYLAGKAINSSRARAEKIGLHVEILKGELDPKTVDLFRKLAKEAGPELCFDVDLPFSEQGFKDWVGEIRTGDRIVAVAIQDNQIVGTLAAVRGGLSFLPIREDGTLSHTIQTVRGFDLTAGYVSPKHRVRGLTGRLMGVELLKAALESKTPEEYVYATVSTGHYGETNNILARLFGWSLEDVQAKSGTVEFFKMFEGLDGARLTPDEVQTIQGVIKLGINPESAAIDVILNGLVFAGAGKKLGYSIDGAEPATYVFGKVFLDFYTRLTK